MKRLKSIFTENKLFASIHNLKEEKISETAERIFHHLIIKNVKSINVSPSEKSIDKQKDCFLASLTGNQVQNISKENKDHDIYGHK